MAYYTKFSCGIWAATFVPSLQLGVTFGPFAKVNET